MQTRSSLQRRSNSESSDRVVVHIKPRSWGDEHHEQPQTVQPQNAGFDFKNADWFSHDPGPRSPVRVFSTIQAKLKVGAPNDVYEQEADRVAEQVMTMPEPAQVQREIAPEEEKDTLHTKPLATTITPLVQRDAVPGQEDEEENLAQTKLIQRDAVPGQEDEDESLAQAKLIQREVLPGQEDEEENLAQTKPSQQTSPDAGFQAGDNLENRLNSSQGGGSLLPDEVRSFMEPRFGADFSQVRVHTGSAAVQMSRDLNAQAFTQGHNIYFGSGKRPGTDALTAHELTHVVQQIPSNSLHSMIHRKKEHEADLAAIQGHAMFNLLPKLQSLPPEVRTDEEAGGFVSGPRLVTAMRVVQSRGMPWLDFAAAHNSELSALPADQIGDIIKFLGTPKDARYFKADQLGKQFDGAVDPAIGVTLFFRVKFELAPTKIGSAQPGTPEWQAEAQKASQKIRQEFAPEFKRVVEDQWSGKGSVKPTCPIGGIKALQTKVVVTVVENGEHMVMYVHPPDAEGRSNASKDQGFGNLKSEANKPRVNHSQGVDSTGRHPEQITTTQIPSAHEFGHAIGLDHSRCPGGGNECYGVTAEERSDIMGAGAKLQVIKRAGKVLHDDFIPFEHIAEQWAKDVFPGALSHCKKWSAG